MCRHGATSHCSVSEASFLKKKYTMWSDKKVEKHRKFVAAFAGRFVSRSSVNEEVLSVEDEDGFSKLKKQYAVPSISSCHERVEGM